jgi:hypothetical protein
VSFVGHFGIQNKSDHPLSVWMETVVRVSQ